MHRHGWDYFQYRWDRMQSADIGTNKTDIVQLQGQVMQLEQMLVYVMAKLAIGEAPPLSDPSVRKFLQIDGVEDPRRAAEELARTFEARHSPRIVTCPSCGAGVRDLPGITNERCGWCGTELRTES